MKRYGLSKKFFLTSATVSFLASILLAALSLSFASGDFPPTELLLHPGFWFFYGKAVAWFFVGGILVSGLTQFIIGRSTAYPNPAFERDAAKARRPSTSR